jgi:hypothetical protein
MRHLKERVSLETALMQLETGEATSSTPGASYGHVSVF